MQGFQDIHDAAPDGARTTRGKFVRQLGTAVAIGLGIALVPATNAYASTTCCTNSVCNGMCPPGQFGQWCTGGTCTPCCACFTDNNCHSKSGSGCIC